MHHSSRRRRPAPLLAGAAALLVACAPSREAALEPVQASVLARLGERPRAPDDSGADIDAEIERLLGKGLDVAGAVRLTLLNSPRLQALYEDVGIARAQVLQASLLENPVVRGQLLVPTRESEGLEVALGLDVDVVSLLFAPLARTLAEAELAASQVRVTGQILEATYRTRSLFYRYLAEAKRVELLRGFVEIAELSADVARRLREAGNITRLELLEEEALFQRARLELIRAERRRAELRAQLNDEMGLTGARTSWRVAAGLPPLPASDEVDLERLVPRALDASLDLELARRRLEAQERRLGLVEARRWVPGLAAGVEAEREEELWSVGPALGVAVPVFDQGQGGVALEEARRRRLRYELRALALRVRAEAQAVRARLTAARASARHLEEVLVPLQREIVDEALLQYNAMTLGVFRLLDARRRQLVVEQQRLDALLAYWLARADYAQLASGRLPSPTGGEALSVPDLDEERERRLEPSTAPLAPEAGRQGEPG